MQTAPVAREKLFNMRMSEEEWSRIERLAEHYSLNAAGVLRMLVKREVDALEKERARFPQAHLRAAIDTIGMTLVHRFRRADLTKLVHRCPYDRSAFDRRHAPEDARAAEERALAILEECSAAPKVKATSDRAVNALRDLDATYVK